MAETSQTETVLIGLFFTAVIVLVLTGAAAVGYTYGEKAGVVAANQHHVEQALGVSPYVLESK